ncbi:MAG: hypothetical protein PWP16_817 [Eubacteriaceae bacterium]|nr:hypothetical protein [Eubacteriaceae bacterium]MDK2905184.1 hypothetical protein [Eubacteriaceae bacterium]MDK2937449.1 hypothetical protein [Eubacteriaceae bacterium]MDK2961582.1 hypothetical protein [Eubacteriaceae bacterium]MDN5307454.1 hypothetical protein [Eubacteriaceae bacterium]
MDLFDELKNKYILASIQLINRLAAYETIEWDEFESAFLMEMDKDDLNIGYDYVTQLKNAYGIFKKDEQNLVKLVYHSDIAIRPSLPEKIWLKSVLNHSDIKLFLEDETIEKLKTGLRDVADIDITVIRKGQFSNGDLRNEELRNKVKLLIQAIEEKRILVFSNQLKNGKVYRQQEALISRIEYSIIDNRFRASLWSLEEERPIKANISQMFDLSLKDIASKPYNDIKTILDQRKANECIELRITNRHRCVERAMLLFSQYERIARWEDANTMLLEIDYYVFDEEELVRNILSLGPMAVVLKPQSIRQRIISVLEGA